MDQLLVVWDPPSDAQLNPAECEIISLNLIRFVRVGSNKNCGHALPVEEYCNLGTLFPTASIKLLLLILLPDDALANTKLPVLSVGFILNNLLDE